MIFDRDDDIIIGGQMEEESKDDGKYQEERMMYGSINDKHGSGSLIINQNRPLIIEENPMSPGRGSSMDDEHSNNQLF
jgi:hypothetical protein